MDFTPRRSSSRLRADLEAQLVTLGGVQPAVILDLATGGAKVLSERNPRLGECMVLRWDGIEAFGTVVWARDGQCGLWFDELIPEEAVLAAREAVDSGARRRHESLRLVARDWVAGHLN